MFDKFNRRLTLCFPPRIRPLVRVSSIIDIERGETRRGLDFVVVRELGAGQPLSPIRLSMIDEYPEILLYFLVHSFSLSVGLRVIGGGKVAGDTDEFVQVLHELGGKLRSPIADDFLR